MSGRKSMASTGVSTCTTSERTLQFLRGLNVRQEQLTSCMRIMNSCAVLLYPCRGFHVCYIREDSAVPEKVDYKTCTVYMGHAPIINSCAVLFCCQQSCLCRGFHVCYIREDSAVPERVDPKTGAVSTILKPCHKFRISFDARGPRDDIKVGSDATGIDGWVGDYFDPPHT